MNDDYKIHIYGPIEGNVDVDVVFSDGRRFAATFFTLNNVQELMDSYAETGECAHGLYFWAEDMLLIDELSEKKIRRAVKSLISEGEFESAFSQLE